MPDSLSTRSLSIRHPQASYSASSPPGSQTSSFRPAGLLVPTAKVTEQPKLTISTSSVLPVLLSARLLSSTGAIASTVRSSCLHFGLPLDTRPASLAPAVGLPAAGACTAAAVGGPDAADESREELDARQELGQRRGEQQKGRLPERLQRSVSLLLTRAWLALSDDEPVCGRAGGSSDADLAFDGCWQTCLGAARRRRSASPMIRCISPTSASTTTPESVRPRRLPLCAGWRPGVGMAVGPKMPGRRTSSV
jgi:hypothetical protein